MVECCHTDNLMPNFPISCLPQSRLDLEVQGLKIIIDCPQPGSSPEIYRPPPISRWSKCGGNDMVNIISQTLKKQNCLKAGTEKPKLKVKMQSVSDEDFLKNHVLSWQRKVHSDEDVTSSGRAFQVSRPATGKARLPTDS